MRGEGGLATAAVPERAASGDGGEREDRVSPGVPRGAWKPGAEHLRVVAGVAKEGRGEGADMYAVARQLACQILRCSRTGGNRRTLAGCSGGPGTVVARRIGCVHTLLSLRH